MITQMPVPGQVKGIGICPYGAFQRQNDLMCSSFKNNGGLKGYVTNIYTDPEYRGRGIATKMLAILEERMKERGVCRIWLEASRWGKPVYEKYGFKENDSIMTIET